MIDRIVNMVIRQLVRKAVNGGVRSALGAGRRALDKRSAARADRNGAAREADQTEIDQDAAISQRRRLHYDERKGDNVLYPTDEYTDGMQPRR